MEYVFGFIAIGVITGLAVMSPGPDFAIVAKNALTHSRRAGLMTTVGVLMGMIVHFTYLILGIGVIISQSIILFSVIKYLGALYLIYLGVLMLRSKGNSLTLEKGQAVPVSDVESFRDGFITNVLNPKATLFFLALFTQVIDPGTALTIQSAYALEILLIAGVWFSFLSYILTTSLVSGFVGKQIKWIERAMGAVLVALGVKVALSSN